MDDKTPSKLPAKALGGFLVFIAGALLSSLRIIHDAPVPNHFAADEVTQRSDQRFASLKQACPAAGIVGYIGESGNSAIPNYYLAQYALAPLVVDPSARHRLVVGNFPNLQHPQLPPGLQLVGDFGNGVFLFLNEDAR